MGISSQVPKSIRQGKGSSTISERRVGSKKIRSGRHLVNLNDDIVRSYMKV